MKLFRLGMRSNAWWLPMKPGVTVFGVRPEGAYHLWREVSTRRVYGLADANPHGMAIKYHLPDGNDMDMVTNSLHFFLVATGEDVLVLLMAVSKIPTDAPHPTAVEQFVATHPSVPLAFATAHTPDSFAHEEYYGINAFVFVNKAGAKQAVRYQIVPEKTVYLDPKDAAKKSADFLVDDLPNRLKDGPVTFHVKAQLAAPGDQTKDASKPWPSWTSAF